MRLLLFSSKRQIKAYYETFASKNCLLEHAMSIGDFTNKLLISPYKKASSYESLLLMAKACKQTKDLESKLKIPSNFFAFLRNNEYIFSFFKELILASKRPSDLASYDLYAQYDEHIAILDDLYDRYFALLKQSKLYDDLSIYLDYSLNNDFLKPYSKIILHLDGFLNSFETKLFKKLSLSFTLQIALQTSIYNLSFQSKNELFSHFSLESDYSYLLDISSQKILSKTKISKNPHVSVMSVSLRFVQAGFVFAKIEEYLKEGIPPEKIVVLTPDEGFADVLRTFDKDNLLSFARGISIKQTKFYLRLNALFSTLKEEFVLDKNKDYYKQELLEKNNSKLRIYDILQDYERLNLDEYYNYEQFEALIKGFLEGEGSELCEMIQMQLLFLEKLLVERLSLRELLELFFIQIQKSFISEARGAKIRVIGLLESRGLAYEGVIIPDFNDDLIPKRASVELFLNNALRKKAGLISYENRENLQRHYYLSLINKARFTSICYVENEEKIPSRFLDENDFCLHEYTAHSQASLASYFLPIKQNKLDLSIKEDFVQKMPEFDNLSFSKLNLFINSKLDFYYHYILKTPPPKRLDEAQDAADFGTIIHALLESYYKKHSSFSLEDFLYLLDKSGLNTLDKAILKLKFASFGQSEAKHFDDGYKILANEQELLCLYRSKKGRQIALKGVIDRVDENEEGVLIIDYKSGKIPKDDAQLEFYRLLYALYFKEDLSKIKACYYDLGTSMQLCVAKKHQDIEDLIEDFANVYESDMILSPQNDEPSPFLDYYVIYKRALK